MILKTTSSTCRKLSIEYTNRFLTAFNPLTRYCLLYEQTRIFTRLGILFTTQLFQVISTFHPSEVDEMSTRNSQGRKLSPSIWLYYLETVGLDPYQKRLQLFLKSIFYSVKLKDQFLFHDFVLLMLAFSKLYDMKNERSDRTCSLIFVVLQIG